MKAIKYVLILILAVALVGGGVIFFKSSPLRSAYKSLSTAESMDYQVHMHLDIPDESSAPLMFTLTQDEIVIRGEYLDHQIHGNCYSGSDDSSFLEFYYDADGDATVNAAPFLKYTLNNFCKDNAILSGLVSKITDQFTDLIVKDSQFYTVTDQHLMPTLPSIPQVDTKTLVMASLFSAKAESSYYADEITGMHFISIKQNDSDTTVCLGIGDITDSGMKIYISSSVDDCPFEAVIDLTIPSSAESITIPENNLTEDQLDLLAAIYDRIQPYLSK